MTLKRKFILAALLTMLPVLTAVLFVTGYAYLPAQRAVSEIHAIHETQLAPVYRAQTMIHAAAMAPNDFLISGNPVEIDEFAASRSRLDRDFAQISRAHPTPAAQSIMAHVNEQWAQAQQFASELLGMDELHRGSPSATLAMKRFDAAMTRVADGFEEMVDHVSDEARGLVEESERRRSVALVALVLGTLGGMLLAFLASLWSVGSILASVQSLHEGIETVQRGGAAHVTDHEESRGELGHLFNAFNTMSEFVAAERNRLREEAMTDDLTGLYNREVLFTKMRTEFDRLVHLPDARKASDKGRFSLLMLDLDHFKRVNDTYGHQAGDAVLRAASDEVAQRIRASDCVARYGGEEIAIYLAQTGPKGALELAGRIRAAIAALRIPADHATIAVTVSIGIASYPDDAQTIETLVKAADDALYRAKRGGRDRVCATGETLLGRAEEVLDAALPGADGTQGGSA